MPTTRMNREQFFVKLSSLDEQQLREALWNLYWRGSAAVRERIEAEIDPEQREHRAPKASEPVDPHRVLAEVREFVELARSGAYLGGDRRVTPRERPRWRFAFQRLVADAQRVLDSEDGGAAASAVELLIDLACETRAFEYFRSEDPMEAARFVVSDAVGLLWGRVRDHEGFRAFSLAAAPQLIRWESRYGWTRSGWAAVSEKETSLASVLARMLLVTDMWVGFAGSYLDALDQVARDGAGEPRRGGQSASRERAERTANLAEWHRLLLDRLLDSDAEACLDRLTVHPALGGAELTFLQAQLAHRRGDVARARDLVHECLHALPGHRDFHSYAAEIGAPIPPRAQEVKERMLGG